MQSILSGRTFYKVFIFILCAMCQFVRAQNLNQIVPEASAVKYGVLENGMSYYICKIPKNQKSSFYAIQRTGSLVEQGDELGLSHFVEHLVFCGTKNYKKHTIIDFVRNIGSDFGKDLNAGTSHEYTFYNFENVPVWNDSVVDNCLLMLRDMMYNAELNDEDIEKERNVIVEEALLRGEEKEMPFYVNTPFSRPVIGDTAIIRNVPARKIREFYHHWYQPQMQAIVIMHSSDADIMLTKIKNIFESVPRGKTEIPKNIELPTFMEPHISIKHNEFGRNDRIVIKLQLLQQRQTNNPQNTIGNYLTDYVFAEKIGIPLMAVFNHLEKLGIKCNISTKKGWNNSQIFEITAYSEKGTPPFVLQSFLSTLKSIRYFGFPEYITKKYIEEDLVWVEKRDSLKWLPTDSELSSNDYAPNGFMFPNPIFEKCKEHFLYGEPIIDSKTEKQISSYFRETIDAKIVQKIFNDIFISSSQNYDITVPQNSTLSKESVLEMIDCMNNTDVKPLLLPNDENMKPQTDFTELLPDIVAGKVISDRRIADDSVREIILSNGIKVLINKSDSENSRLYAFRRGGYGLIDSAKIRKFNVIERSFDDKIYHNLTCYRKASHDIYEVESIYQWEKELKAFYQELTDTELDSVLISKKWVEEWNKSRSDFVVNYQKRFIPNNYITHLEDSVLTRSNLKEIREIWKNYKSNYNGMVVAIDCAIDEDSIIPHIKRYIGGLPFKSEPPRVFDYDYYIQYDSVLIDTVLNQKQNAITLSLFQERNFSYTPENFILHKAVKYLLQNSIIDSIRLKNGDIYSASVESDIDLFSHPHQSYTISLTFSPHKMGKIITDLKELIYEMAYGDGIAQQMIDNFVMSLYANGGYQPIGSKAVQMMNEIMQNGVVIDTRKMNFKKVVTIEAIKRFLQDLIEKGHHYKYVVVSKTKF